MKSGGLLGFIVHKNLLKVESYKQVRKIILENCEIQKIVDLGSTAFSEITGETVILILKKSAYGKTNQSNKIEILRPVSDSTNSEMINVGYVQQSTFLGNPDYVFSIYSSNRFSKLQEKIKNKRQRLEECADIVSNGLNTVDNKKYLAEVKIDGQWILCILGKDIAQFGIKKRRFVLYDDRYLSRKGDVNTFKRPDKIVIQRIGSGLVAAIDYDKTYCFNSVNMILKKK